MGEKLKRFIAMVSGDELQRFDAAAEAVDTEVNQQCRNGDSGWCKAAKDEVERARKVRKECRLEEAWTVLNAAKRRTLRSLGWSELVSEAHATRCEADEKLSDSDWRRDVVMHLLPRDLLDEADLLSRVESIESVLTPRDAIDVSEKRSLVARIERAEELIGWSNAAERELELRLQEIERRLSGGLHARLVKAREIIDERNDNVYRKFRLLQKNVLRNTVILAAVLAVVAAFVALAWVPEAILSDNSPLASWRLLLVVMGFGALGAFFSAATELRTREQSIRIPEARVYFTLMWMRPVVGAAGAVIVIVVLQSGLGGTVTLSETGILPVAIAAGFTERFVTKTVRSAANAASK